MDNRYKPGFYVKFSSPKNSSSQSTISWYTESTTGGIDYDTITHPYENIDGTLGFIPNFWEMIKPIMDMQSFLRGQYVSQVEERLEEFLLDNYDRYEIVEYGHYIYDVIQEKAYEIASEIIEKLKDEVSFNDTDEIIIEAMLAEVDFESLYDVVDDILNAPITMEEKLAEVGMSYRDFL